VTGEAGSEFDADTRLTASAADGTVFEADLTDRWDTLNGINGGFMLALTARALARVMPFPDPVVVSGFFLRPGSHGPAQIRTELIRAGKTTAFGQASLWQDGKEVLRATAAFTDLAAAAERSGHAYSGFAPPALPPPDACPSTTGTALPGLSIADRIEYRPAELPHWAAGGAPSGNPRYEFWMRFRDGREPDAAALPLFVDAAAPAVLEAGVLVSTTVELTVHLRARPTPGWLACRASTRYVSGGYHEEDVEIWDSAGALVAQSRQLALILG
jgi:acyl-CoA thioesterase